MKNFDSNPQQSGKENKELRSLAHDLNNILSSTLHSISLLKQSVDKKSENFELIKIIEINSKRTSEMLGDILNSSTNQNESDKIIDLSRLLNEVIIAFTPLLPAEIKLSTNIQSKINPVSGNRSEIYRAILKAEYYKLRK